MVVVQRAARSALCRAVSLQLAGYTVVVAEAATSYTDLRRGLDDLDLTGCAERQRWSGHAGLLPKIIRVSVPWTIWRRAPQARHLQLWVRRQGLEPRTQWTRVTVMTVVRDVRLCWSVVLFGRSDHVQSSLVHRGGVM